jgi:Kef-type K+ transport system membrane component KefB
MHVLDFIRVHLRALPDLAKFAVGLALIVGLPPLLRRMRIPDVIGLMLAGVFIGPHGIGLIATDHPVASFLAQLGILMLMFFAGLELDLALFQKAKHKAYMFGPLTTVLPMLLGTIAGLWFGFLILPAIVIGSLLAPHTLIGLPIATRLNLTRAEPVIVTIGATVVADTLSLVTFAIGASTFQTGFSIVSTALKILEIAIFVPVLLIGVSRLGGWLLKKVENDENAYFVLMLAILAVSGVIADSIRLPNIVGAFLAGLAVNAAVEEKPAKNKLKFFGDSLFIPIFFIVTGFLIDPVTFVRAIASNFAFVIVILVAAALGKGIAAEVAGRAFAYSREARGTMWSLSLPHVASTLAAALVATRTLNNKGAPLLDATLLNIVLVLVVTTAILGPVLTERFAPHMLPDVPKSSVEPVTG